MIIHDFYDYSKFDKAQIINELKTNFKTQLTMLVFVISR